MPLGGGQQWRGAVGASDPLGGHAPFIVPAVGRKWFLRFAGWGRNVLPGVLVWLWGTSACPGAAAVPMEGDSDTPEAQRGCHLLPAQGHTAGSEPQGRLPVSQLRALSWQPFSTTGAQQPVRTDPSHPLLPAVPGSGGPGVSPVPRCSVLGAAWRARAPACPPASPRC